MTGYAIARPTASIEHLNTSSMFLKRFRQPRPGVARPATDAELLATYRATGHLEALGELYERHIDLVYAVCYKYLRDEADSKDAVMQLFEQLTRDLQRHEVDNFRSWLHSVARNYCLMLLRSRKHALVDVADAPPDVAADAEDSGLDLEHNLSQLSACMARLPAEQRRCIELFYLEQKSYADVATLTDLDLKQVKSHLQNGRRNLKLCVERNRER